MFFLAKNIRSNSIAKWFIFAIFLYFLIPPTQLRAESKKDFEIFDGRMYNKKFYPRIDIIEWGEPISHMEFQVYWKGHPLKMTFQLEKKDGKKVMLVNYFIKERNEHVCRRVVAPSHFDDNFMVYSDTSDKDMDNTIVTMNKLPEKKGLALVTDQPTYTGCAEDESEREVASKDKSPAPVTFKQSDKSEPLHEAKKEELSEESDSEEEEDVPPPPKARKKHTGTTLRNKSGGSVFSDW